EQIDKGHVAPAGQTVDAMDELPKFDISRLGIHQWNWACAFKSNRGKQSHASAILGKLGEEFVISGDKLRQPVRSLERFHLTELRKHNGGAVLGELFLDGRIIVIARLLVNGIAFMSQTANAQIQLWQANA